MGSPESDLHLHLMAQAAAERKDEAREAISAEFIGRLSAGETIFDGTNTWDFGDVVVEALEDVDASNDALLALVQATEAGSTEGILDAAAKIHGLLMTGAQKLADRQSFRAYDNLKRYGGEAA